MKNVSLTGKILAGVALMLVPLAFTLTSVVQFGSSTITVARAEQDGLTVSSPVLNAALLWQLGGPSQPADTELLGQLDDFLALLPQYPSLNRGEEGLRANGYTWMDPQAIREAVARGASGDPRLFAELEARMLDHISALADESGLVLDPDIDSYYLMLAIYDSLPSLLLELTSLREAVGTGRTLPASARVAALAAVRSLQTANNRFRSRVLHSVSADASTYGPVEGYRDQVTPMMTAAGVQMAELTKLVQDSATSGALDRPQYDAALEAFTSLLDGFHDVALKVLNSMLEQRMGAATGSLTVVLLETLAGLIFGLFVLLIVLLDVRFRVKRLEAALAALAAGDLTVELPARLTRSGDELGRLAHSVTALRRDLRQQVGQIESTSANLEAIGSTLGANSEQSAAAIEEMSATSSHVARFSAQQSENTQNSSQSVSQVLAQIAQANTLTSNMAAQFFMFGQSMEANRRRIQATAQEAAHSSELAAALSTTGEEGAKSLQSLNQSIAAVVQRTGEIQEVVQIILDIADRSSLLSMNAAIEAAHAGASGKGFAVVAEEIRKLANTSAQQAQTIKSLLGGIAAATETTRARSEATELSFQSLNSNIEAVRQAGTSISQQMKLQEAEDDRLTDGLVEFTNFYALLATSMEEQMSRSQQVKHLVDEVSDASQQISHSMTEQKIGMEQATEAVIQVRETAVQLATIISSLRDEVARFRLS